MKLAQRRIGFSEADAKTIRRRTQDFLRIARQGLLNMKLSGEQHSATR